MDFSICFLAGGQMLPGALAVPWAAIATARPTTPTAARAKTLRVRFMICFYDCVERVACYFAGTSRITIPGVDAARPSPVPEPVGFCSST